MKLRLDVVLVIGLFSESSVKLLALYVKLDSPHPQGILMIPGEMILDTFAFISMNEYRPEVQVRTLIRIQYF